MRLAKKHYAQILQIELEDLKEDLDCMLNKALSDWKEKKITERVYKENSTLFKNEKLGVDEFSVILNKIDLETFHDVESMIIYLKNQFRTTAERLALANAVVICIERKLDKVKRYVNSDIIR
ncbi:hypothetical protein KAR48_01585 [bacterium]|nr:hypothetical protein [bacterium]